LIRATGKEVVMRVNFQASYLTAPQTEAEAFCSPVAKPVKKHIAKPRKNPNVALVRKKVFARYRKTLAYLAK
jgi:hypothetical protein